ncbi:MAG: alpha-L-fucosidase [Armatimonadetes bacterium]|nr:alpha-L-fucosidase [Armatimonadota bacterium]
MSFSFGDARDWFFEHRFGLFVHWGLYALGGWHEQDQFRRSIPRDHYAAQIHQFDPQRFDPDAWLDIAENAGMSYLCFTTKHIDGFCMWDSDETEYKVTRTPYGRDVLTMLADACHRRGFPLCLYYSVADMHHPHYPSAGRSYELPAPDPGDEPDLGKYLAYVEAQVRELCTRYGEIHGFWWDANVIEHRDPRFNALIRELQPSAVINGRGFGEGDFDTPEREYERAVDEVLVFDRPTEACQSVGMESWGYRADEDYYTVAHLVRSMDKILAKGGNYLLNPGPRGDGTFPEEALRVLEPVGHWYKTVREAFEGAEPAPGVTDNRTVLVTRKGSTLYVHLHRPAVGTALYLPPFAVLPESAVLLNTGASVETSIDLTPARHAAGPCLRLRNLPLDEMPGTVPVIRLDFASLEG